MCSILFGEDDGHTFVRWPSFEVQDARAEHMHKQVKDICSCQGCQSCNSCFFAQFSASRLSIFSCNFTVCCLFFFCSINTSVFFFLLNQFHFFFMFLVCFFNPIQNASHRERQRCAPDPSCVGSTRSWTPRLRSLSPRCHCLAYDGRIYRSTAVLCTAAQTLAVGTPQVWPPPSMGLIGRISF